MDYSDPNHPDHGVTDGLDMDMVHDFGEGVGLDMRDFTSHDVEDGLGQGDHALDPSLTAPSTLHHAPKQESGVSMDDMFHAETGLDDDDEEDDGDETPDGTTGNKRQRHADVPGGFTYVDKDGEPGRRKIRIEYIGDKSRRHITFSKRKAGIMKKAYELSILTGTQVLLLVVSETGLVYTFTTTKLQPMVQKAEGKNLIQACLNAPDGYGPDGQPLTGPVSATKAKNGGLAIRPHKLTAAASAAMAASAQAASASNAQAQEEHQQQQQQQQLDAAAQVGQGAPSTAGAAAARPKKRLPSGKGKKAQAAAAAQASADGMPTQPDHIPPVPQIPDMHRPGGSSPHQQQPHTPTMMSLQAPYGIPQEYQPHASPTQASFYHSPSGHPHHQPPPGEYGYYGGGGGHHPHNGYMMHQHQPHPHAHASPMQYGDSRSRMMLESQNRSMQGMGYVGGPQGDV